MSGSIGIIMAIGCLCDPRLSLILSLLFSIRDYGTAIASPVTRSVMQIFLDAVGEKGAVDLMVSNAS
jgi:hypothetical protein